MTGRDSAISDRDFRDAILSELGPAVAADRLVALAVLQHAGAAGCFAGERTLAAETALARNTIRAAMRRLVDAGWLSREVRHRGKGEYKTYTYWPTMPIAGGANGAPSGANGAPLDAGQTVTQVAQGWGNGGANGAPKAGQMVTPNSLNYEESADALARKARAPLKPGPNLPASLARLLKQRAEK